VQKQNNIHGDLCTLNCTWLTSAFASLAPDERIWLIGDSNGFLIKPLLAKKAKNAGLPFGGSPVAGSTVIQWCRELNREKWQLATFKPTLILVALGANDACMGTRIIANEPPFLKCLLTQLRRTGARRVIWLGPPKIGSTEPKVCYGMKDCLARAVPGLDAFKAMLTGAGEAYLDGREAGAEMDTDLLHPTVKGRATWVDWVWNELSR
jgi:lysophospholipase L1-like esterase